MSLVPLLARWVPPLLKAMPYIIKAVFSLKNLWEQVRKTQIEDETVLKSLEILKEHQDDIDKFIEDPKRRQALMEGLVILMTKIQNVDRSQKSLESSKHSSSGNCESQKYLSCSECTENFNTTDRKPMLLPMCGHTLCKLCLRETSTVNQSYFRCPICRKVIDCPVEDFPTNISVLQLVSTEDDSHCEKGKSELPSSSITLSYEEQIRYALFLSVECMDEKKEIDNICSSYRSEEQDCFLTSAEEEKLEQEDHPYKNQDSARPQSYEKTAITWSDYISYKDISELDQGNSDQGYMTNTSLQENADDSLQLALRLQKEEIQQAENFFGDQELIASNSLQGKASQKNADSLQLAVSLQEEELQQIKKFHRDQELMELKSSQKQTSTSGEYWQIKKKRREIKEKEDIALAIALSLSFQDEPNTEQADYSDHREADFTE